MEQVHPVDTVPSSAKLHHTALCRGYVARTGQGYVLPYKGHFGRGYVYHSPSYMSAGYHQISYYIEEERDNAV